MRSRYNRRDLSVDLLPLPYVDFVRSDNQTCLDSCPSRFLPVSIARAKPGFGFGGGGGHPFRGEADPLFFASYPKSQGSPLMYLLLATPGFRGGGPPPPWLRPCSIVACLDSCPSLFLPASIVVTVPESVPGPG